MNWIDILFGHGKDLNMLQMSMRAIAAFFETLLFLRIAGIRTFGKKTAFDNVIVIMLGSILSRVVVGASPFVPTSVACLVFVLIHWALGKLSYHIDFVGKLVKGSKLVLFKDGQMNESNMKRANISEKDLYEGVRLKINEDSLQNVHEVIIERNGDISIVKRTEQKM